MERIKVDSPEMHVKTENIDVLDETRVDRLITDTSLATVIVRVKNPTVAVRFKDEDSSSSESSEESSDSSEMSSEEEEAHQSVINALPATRASLPYVPVYNEEFSRLQSKYKLRQCYVSLERCQIPKNWRRNNKKKLLSSTTRALTTRKFKCLVSNCSETFNRIADRNHHMFSLHSESRSLELENSPCPCTSVMISKTTEGANKDLISFECKVCNKEFVKSSFTGNNFLCEHSTCSCKTLFLNFEDLMTHHRNICSVTKTQGGPVECSECGQGFHLTQCLLSHQYHSHRSVHMKTIPGLYACTCSTSLIDNVKDQGETVYFSCKRCKREFKKADFLDASNEVSAICDHSPCGCNERYTDFHEFFLHHRKVCSQQGFESQSCSECGQEFFNEQCWIAHRVNAHDLEKPYECHICHKAYPTNYYLTGHKFAHLGKKHQCEICGAAFALQSTLNAHTACVHVKKLRFQCDVCGKKLVNSTAFCHHMDIHKPKTLPCHICGYLCKSPRLLRGHIYRNHEQRPAQIRKLKLEATKDQQHECDICGDVFKSSRNLTGHKTLYHDPPRTDLNCGECGKKFTVPFDLKRHMDRHKPHDTPCHVCGKMFKSRRHVNTHVYYVHDKRRPTKAN